MGPGACDSWRQQGQDRCAVQGRGTMRARTGDYRQNPSGFSSKSLPCCQLGQVRDKRAIWASRLRIASVCRPGLRRQACPSAHILQLTQPGWGGERAAAWPEAQESRGHSRRWAGWELGECVASRGWGVSRGQNCGFPPAAFLAGPVGAPPVASPELRPRPPPSSFLPLELGALPTLDSLNTGCSRYCHRTAGWPT